MIKKRNFNKYLPSKKFQTIFGSILIIAIILFLIFNVLPNRKKFNKEKSLEVDNKTIIEIIGEDSDEDGIPNWEEKLWGTDPNNKFTFGETSDSQYIENKKKELNIPNELNEKELTETDKFAREFFASYVALSSKEGVDQETIQNFSKNLGEKIVSSEIKSNFNKKEVKVNEKDNTETRNDYYKKIKNLYQKYQDSGIGDELNIVSNGLLSYYNEGKNQKYEELLLIGQSYQEFSSKMMEIYVPASLVDYHINIANAAYNTGVGVINMSKVIEDPIIGISGLSIYQEYSEKLIDSVSELDKIIEEGLE